MRRTNRMLVGWGLGLLIGMMGRPTEAPGAMVAQYLFDEGGGTAVGDTTGAGNNAIFVGTPTWARGHNAASPQALYFNGAGYVRADDSASLDTITTGFSLSAWIRPTVDSTHDTIVWKPGAFHVWKQNGNLMVTLDGVAGASDLVIIPGPWSTASGST